MSRPIAHSGSVNNEGSIDISRQNTDINNDRNNDRNNGRNSPGGNILSGELEDEEDEMHSAMRLLVAFVTKQTEDWDRVRQRHLEAEEEEVKKIEIAKKTPFGLPKWCDRKTKHSPLAGGGVGQRAIRAAVDRSVEERCERGLETDNGHNTGNINGHKNGNNNRNNNGINAKNTEEHSGEAKAGNMDGTCDSTSPADRTAIHDYDERIRRGGGAAGPPSASAPLPNHLLVPTSSPLPTTNIPPKIPRVSSSLEKYPYIVSKLSTYSNLKYLYINSVSVRMLSVCLRSNPLITHLTLAACGLTCDSVSILCSALPSMSSLTYLDLSQNSIKDEGATSILKYLHAALDRGRAGRGWGGTGGGEKGNSNGESRYVSTALVRGGGGGGDEGRAAQRPASDSEVRGTHSGGVGETKNDSDGYGTADHRNGCVALKVVISHNRISLAVVAEFIRAALGTDRRTAAIATQLTGDNGQRKDNRLDSGYRFCPCYVEYLRSVRGAHPPRARFVDALY